MNSPSGRWILGLLTAEYGYEDSDAGLMQWYSEGYSANGLTEKSGQFCWLPKETGTRNPYRLREAVRVSI